MKKKCFFRHGNYQTIKIIEHRARIFLNKNNESNNPRDVKRVTTIEKCGYCGKLIVEDNYD